ncbi:MAG: STAS domain-containing protein [Kutzneria sp.]|nr:STAS domain-containing protein [Kutzneria sp.]
MRKLSLTGDEPTPVDLVHVTVDHPGAGITVLTVSGEVDMSTAPLVRDTALTELASATLVVLDLNRVEFFGSPGLNVLLELRQRAIEIGVELRVVASTRAVTRPLVIAEITSVFHLHDHLQDALATLV